MRNQLIAGLGVITLLLSGCTASDNAFGTKPAKDNTYSTESSTQKEKWPTTKYVNQALNKAYKTPQSSLYDENQKNMNIRYSDIINEDSPTEYLKITKTISGNVFSIQKAGDGFYMYYLDSSSANKDETYILITKKPHVQKNDTLNALSVVAGTAKWLDADNKLKNAVVVAAKPKDIINNGEVN